MNSETPASELKSAEERHLLSAGGGAGFRGGGATRSSIPARSLAWLIYGAMLVGSLAFYAWWYTRRYLCPIHGFSESLAGGALCKGHRVVYFALPLALAIFGFMVYEFSRPEYRRTEPLHTRHLNAFKRGYGGLPRREKFHVAISGTWIFVIAFIFIWIRWFSDLWV